jgi:hypothetical protein
LLELDGDGLGVALEHGGTRAGRADDHLARSDPALADAAEDLPRLASDLLLLVRDERDHVVEDVERDDAGRAARAACS